MITDKNASVCQCDPNCYIEKWILCGTDESRTAEFQIGLFALRDIKAGEELTYDYGWSAFRPRTVTGAYATEVVPEACLCRAANCAGILGAKKTQQPKPAPAKGGKRGRKRRGRPPKAIAAKVANEMRKTGASRLHKAGALGRPAEAAVKLATKVIAKRAEQYSRTRTRAHTQEQEQEQVQVHQRAQERGRVTPEPQDEEASLSSSPLSSVSSPGSVSSASTTEQEQAAWTAFAREQFSSPSSVLGSLVDDSEAGGESKPLLSSDFSSDASTTTSRRRGRGRRSRSGEGVEHESAAAAAERRARNAFLARVRRASKRGIVIDDPSQHPLRKQSIPVTAAPENTYIPALPSSLTELGMTTAEARRARNAFLARVRRGVKRGLSKEEAIQAAAKPLPEDEEKDTIVMRAARLHRDSL